ncbi:hypothetical protein BDP27DRAFT_1330321 [Rhodocollybia butyracea]|uniref:Uncharacterized protein n=1 Tax=Rhodocollybia butyracea TaxID=206335 RepID=A0A9P5U568_9AGAR|nr:hypothetical protein BDP27DRAFT_1330321 [Rhodocollybia butyracea]
MSTSPSATQVPAGRSRGNTCRYHYPRIRVSVSHGSQRVMGITSKKLSYLQILARSQKQLVGG